MESHNNWWVGGGIKGLGGPPRLGYGSDRLRVCVCVCVCVSYGIKSSVGRIQQYNKQASWRPSPFACMLSCLFFFLLRFPPPSNPTMTCINPNSFIDAVCRFYLSLRATDPAFLYLTLQPTPHPPHLTLLPESATVCRHYPISQLMVTRPVFTANGKIPPASITGPVVDMCNM